MSWNSTVYLMPIPSCLVRENAENMYYFSALALTLNELEDGVATTDSRLRPDQRLMEDGRWDEANSEKQRLEEKQRAVRRRREAEASDALDEGMRPRTVRVSVCLSASSDEKGERKQESGHKVILCMYGSKSPNHY